MVETQRELLKSHIRSFIYLENFQVSSRRKSLIYCKIFFTILLIIGNFTVFGKLEDHFIIRFGLNGVLLYFISTLIASFMSLIIISSYRKRNNFGIYHHDNFTIGISRYFRVLNLIVVLIGLLFISGVDSGKLLKVLGSLSFLAILVSMVFKDYITNVIDGFILMFSHKFKLGDYVKVGDSALGKIKDITFLHTEIKTDDGDVMFIPNTRMISAEVIDFSKSKFKKINLNFDLAIRFLSKVNEIENYIKDRIEEKYGSILSSDWFYMRISAIGTDTVNINVEVIVTEFNFYIEEYIKKDLSKIILHYINHYFEPIKVEGKNFAENKYNEVLMNTMNGNKKKGTNQKNNNVGEVLDDFLLS